MGFRDQHVNFKVTVNTKNCKDGEALSKDEFEEICQAILCLVGLAKDKHGAGCAFRTTWFGKEGTSNAKKVLECCTTLKSVLTSEIKSITFKRVVGGGLAACNIAGFAKAASLGEVEKHTPHKTIQINNGWFWDDTSWGEKVGSIIHEMTHLILATKDFEQDGCYGPVNCDALARKKSVTALNNAESWGYYMAEYRAFAGQDLKGMDWSYMANDDAVKQRTKRRKLAGKL